MTFVELMVVIAIMGIMTGIGFMSLQSSKSDANLKAAQREVASAIKLAQSYALQGKIAPDGKAPCGYGFRFKTATDHEIFYKPTTGGKCDTPGASTQSEHSIWNNGVALDASSQINMNDEIYFTIPFGTMSGTGIISLSYPGATDKTITINSGGKVTEN